MLAYDKDPVTGIVRHLDDQCIGCQYCVFKCPYDVPRYSPAKGIVRKCDMCHDRLASGEAPACVQSCPNEAIRIRTVDIEMVVEESEAGQLLPSAPEPGCTLPTTTYKTNRALPKNALPTDYYSVQRQHSHLALVVMLVLTQMSVGAFVVLQWLLFSSSGTDRLLESMRPAHVLAALVLGLLGLAAAILHLGRPAYAYRAILGLKTSWLSREILAFGVFAGSASVHGLCELFGGRGASSVSFADVLGMTSAASGVVAVGCSVMIYVDTHRPLWSGPRTATKFFLTAVVLGVPTVVCISLAASAWHTEISARHIMDDFGRSLCQLLMVAVATKLASELTIFGHLYQHRLTPLKRTAQLMLGDLRALTAQRFVAGCLGGLVLPLLIIDEWFVASRDGSPVFTGLLVALTLGTLLVGELIERYLFFASSAAPRMPGAPAT